MMKKRVVNVVEIPIGLGVKNTIVKKRVVVVKGITTWSANVDNQR